MNIETTLKTLQGIEADIRAAIANRDHILDALEKLPDRPGRTAMLVTRTVATGHLPNAAGAVQRAIENLQGFVAKVAEVKANNDKLQPPQEKATETPAAN